MKVLSLTAEGNSLIESWAPALNHFSPQKKEAIEDVIVVVTPHSIERRCELPGANWQVIHEAWRRINSNKNESCLNDWRKLLALGTEIIPGTRIYKLKKSECGHFFLISKKSVEATSFLNNIIIIVNAWQHFKSGRAFLHGAGIIRQKQAYLFLGPSGAGKSTVAGFSMELGHRVLHDDHLVAFNSNGRIFLSDVSLKGDKVLLGAIFVLRKSNHDRLIAISQKQTAISLFNSHFETMAEKALHGEYLDNVFRLSAKIARYVPGYELHFTKTCSFWKTIEDELVL